MKPLQRTALRLFFYVEIVLFFWSYLFGLKGLSRLMQVQNSNIVRIQEIQVLKDDISHLERTIEQWKKYPFYKEKIARELLQMSREHDEVYYVN